MKEFILTLEKNKFTTDFDIIPQISNIITNTGEDKEKKLKKLIFDFSFTQIDNGIQKHDLKETINKVFSNIKTLWFDIKRVFKNEKLENTLSNIYINYHINKFKNTESKIEKDIHFAKIFELMETFVINIAKKENMWRYDEDLVAAWNIGLFKSINSEFDPLQADFTTFSYMKIRKEIQDEKGKINPGFNMPNVHNYYFSVYSKNYKSHTWLDEIDIDEKILNETVCKLKKWNEGVTENLLKDIVYHKTNPFCSLDNTINEWESNDGWTYLDLIESPENIFEDINTKIDNDILRTNLSNFLWKFPDFEKTILERKFWFDFGWDNTYPVYQIKVTRDWQEWIKEMVALKWVDAMKRVELLWYKILSTRKEVEKTKRYETIVWWSLEKLKEYFEIKKLTNISETAIRKSEVKIIKQLWDYLKDVLNQKWINNSVINIIS